MPLLYKIEYYTIQLYMVFLIILFTSLFLIFILLCVTIYDCFYPENNFLYLKTICDYLLCCYNNNNNNNNDDNKEQRLQLLKLRMEENKNLKNEIIKEQTVDIIIE